MHPAGKATLTTIHGEVFKRHLEGEKLRAAVAELRDLRAVRTTANRAKNKLSPEITVELIA